jgi:pimeloyl-ACP methyl ester carboxylesterase
MTEPEHIEISGNGLTFAALAWGDADAPLALLLHGYPDTAWTWRHLGPHLASRGWRAVAPFARGYGPSSLAPDGDYRLAALAQDAVAIADALGGDERAVLVGHDWGALTVWRVAEVAPGRFASLVSLAVPPPLVILRPLGHWSRRRQALRQLRLSWYALFNTLPGAHRALDRLIPHLWSAWSPGHDAAADLEHLWDALDTPSRRKAALLYYRHNFVMAAKPLFLGSPTAAVLHLHGRNDGCAQAELVEQSPGDFPPGSTWEVLEGCGHFLQLERPDEVNARIEDWLAS